MLTNEPELQHSRGTEHLSPKCCMLCARGRRLPVGVAGAMALLLLLMLLLLDVASFMLLRAFGAPRVPV